MFRKPPGDRAYLTETNAFMAARPHYGALQISPVMASWPLLDPALDVGGVLPGVVADAELVADHQGGDLGAQFLLGVADAAEGVGQVPVQAGGMPDACPSS